MAGDLFAIGRITGCFGIKGYCKFELLTDFPERLKNIRSVFVGFDALQPVARSVETLRVSGATAQIKFESIDDRESAEQFVGQIIFITREFLTKLKKGRYFVHDLVGCEVVTVEGVHVGTIVDVHKFSAQDIWVVRDEGKEYLIPAVKEFIDSVDIAKKIVVIRAMEGLLDG